MLDVAQLSDLETAKQVAQLLEYENKRLHARLGELTKTLAELRGENGPEPSVSGSVILAIRR